MREICRLLYVVTSIICINRIMLAQEDSHIIKVACSESVKWLKNNCDTCAKWFEYPDGHCVAFERIGLNEGHIYFYGMYEPNYTRKDSSEGMTNYKSAVVFESTVDTNQVTPILAMQTPDGVDSWIDAPRLFKTRHGYVFHIYTTCGNGGFDFGGYFLHDKGVWQELEIPNWSEAFGKSLPEGYWLCRGGEVDLSAMKAVFPVFTKEDACCCPTGGTITADLDIEGAKVIVRQLHYSAEVK